MSAINRVIELLSSVSGSLYNAYLGTRGWIYPFSSVAIFFYGLSSLFASVSWQVYYFGQWVSNVTSRIAKILSYENIASYFRSIFDAALAALEWIRNASRNIINTIDTWWSGARLTVQGWIDYARQALQSGIDTLSNALGTIRQAWDSFKSKIPTIDEVLNWFRTWRDKVIATMVSWGVLTGTEIRDLLASKVKDLEPFWAGWQDMRAQVVEFFTDPGKWFFDRIEGWLERFW